MPTWQRLSCARRCALSTNTAINCRDATALDYIVRLVVQKRPESRPAASQQREEVRPLVLPTALDTTAIYAIGRLVIHVGQDASVPTLLQLSSARRSLSPPLPWNVCPVHCDCTQPCALATTR